MWSPVGKQNPGDLCKNVHINLSCWFPYGNEHCIAWLVQLWVYSSASYSGIPLPFRMRRVVWSTGCALHAAGMLANRVRKGPLIRSRALWAGPELRYVHDHHRSSVRGRWCPWAIWAVFEFHWGLGGDALQMPKVCLELFLWDWFQFIRLLMS